MSLSHAEGDYVSVSRTGGLCLCLTRDGAGGGGGRVTNFKESFLWVVNAEKVKHKVTYFPQVPLATTYYTREN